MSSELSAKLADCANRLRIDAIESTAAAQSGHPTSSGTLKFKKLSYF